MKGGENRGKNEGEEGNGEGNRVKGGERGRVVV